jgi:glucosylceramidase
MNDRTSPAESRPTDGRPGCHAVARVVVLAAIASGGAVVATGATAAAATAGTDWTAWVSSPADAAVRLAPRTETGGAATASVLIDPQERHQTWTGVGAALTDAATVLLADHPSAVDLLFDPAADDGAHLNLLRLPLSATDFSTQDWTWSWNAKRQFVRPSSQALAAIDLVGDIAGVRSDLDVIATPWTAPASMKTNRDLAGGSLRSNKTATYADMLAAQAAWLIDHGVPLGAITLGNEPGYAADYPSMTMSDAQMSSMANRIAGDLDDLGVDLYALDHNWSDRSRADSLLTAAPFDGVAFHCYGGAPDQMAGVSVPAVVTECTGTTDNWWSTFGWDSRELVVNSALAGSTGLFMWNLALDPQHGPKAAGDCENCRGLLTIDPATGSVQATPEYYTLAHVARAAEPGAVRIGTTTVAGVPVVAFVDPDGTIGVFGHNDTASAQTISFHVRGGDVHTFTVAPGEMFTLRGSSGAVSSRLVPAGFALTGSSGVQLTETEWVCTGADLGAELAVGMFSLGAASTTDRSNCIVRAPEGDAHYVNDDGQREWIPDGSTWFCETSRGTPVIDTSRAFVDHLVDAGWHTCEP